MNNENNNSSFERNIFFRQKSKIIKICFFFAKTYN